MASYTYNSNIVASDPNQYFTLNITFENGVISWNVAAKRQDGQTGNVVRNNIYGLNVNIGGNNYYKGDIAWGDYTVGSVIFSGTTQLANCTIANGLVAIGLTGNFYYGTWNTAYTCTISSSLTVVSPTVSAPSYSASNKYGNVIVGNYSILAFTFSATAGTSGNTISRYRLYQDGTLVYNGTAASCTLVAPSAGSHTYYVVAVESNGATGQSSSITITTVVYTPPAFISVDSVRWSTGTSSGVASDDGEYARLTPKFTKSKVGDTELSTTCKITVIDTNNTATVIGTTATSGTDLFTGQILSPDEMYLVVYELYDSVSGTTAYIFTLDTAPITRIDIISIGSRGLDLIHDSTDGYGIAAGMKATAGYADTALPLRVVDIDSSGNITDEADIYATPTILTSGVISRSSGKGIDSQAYAQWGRVASLTLVMSGDDIYRNVGENIFEGTVASAYRPKVDVMGVGYWGHAVYVGWLKPNGELIVRLSGYAAGYTMNSYAVISWTYIV